MKTLYDKNFRWTPEASALDTRIHEALQPLFEEYVAKGYSPREISHVVHGASMQLELMAVLNPLLQAGEGEG